MQTIVISMVPQRTECPLHTAGPARAMACPTAGTGPTHIVDIVGGGGDPPQSPPPMTITITIYPFD